MIPDNGAPQADGLSRCASSQQAVSPVPASIPSAHTLIIDRAEYARRREDELSSAMQSRKVFGSWAAYAQSLLHGFVTFERDAGAQWGSFHHQCAYAAAGLQDELEAQAIEARRAETAQTGSVHESAVPEGDAPETDSTPHKDENHAG